MNVGITNVEFVKGFQSKITSDRGSYVIASFYNKTMDILSNNQRTVSNLYCFYQRKFLYEIFDEIQESLHMQGKQLPTFMFNDGTMYIRFKKNRKKDDRTSVEQITILKNNEDSL